MEGSRIRTLLGAGLVLLGGLLLLRALTAPITLVGSPMLAMREVEELERDQQQARIEIQRAQLEAQRELERARLEAQRALSEAQANTGAEMPPLPPMPALPAVPPLPPMPPAPPAAPLFQPGAWLSPPVVLVALLALLLWRRGRLDRAPQQV